MDMSVTKNLNNLGLDKRVYEIAARKVLKGHAKRALAYDIDGIEVNPESWYATSWCAYGAIGVAHKQISGEGLFPGNWMKEEHSVHRHLKGFADFMGFENNNGVCEWNNHPDQTGEKVAAKFREFAATL